MGQVGAGWGAMVDGHRLGKGCALGVAKLRYP